MSLYFKPSFWKQAFERAFKTAAQTAAVTIGSTAVNVIDLDAAEIAGLSAGAALLSVLTSVGSAQVASGGNGSPSLVDEKA